MRRTLRSNTSSAPTSSLKNYLDTVTDVRPSPLALADARFTRGFFRRFLFTLICLGLLINCEVMGMYTMIGPSSCDAVVTR